MFALKEAFMRAILNCAVAFVFALSAGIVRAGEHIKIEDVPPAARQTIDREVAGGNITKVERETEHGQVIYKVEYIHDRQEWEIRVAADGKLLRKERD
jgi:hypothetical protein